MKDNLNHPFNVMRHKSWDNAPRLEAAAQYLIGLGVAAPIAYVGAYVGIHMVTSWAINALSPKPDFGAAGQRGLLTNVREANAPQEVVYGEVRKGGVITYMEATGTNNEYLHMIIALAGHEINSIDEIYINDQQVTIDATNFVTSSDWVNDSDPKIYIRKFTGTPTQNIYSTINGIANGPQWQGKETGDDTNFRGQGIACLYVRLKYHAEVFAQGIPLITAKIKGKKVEDPRNSTTAYSANAALCIRDYLISKYGMNATGEIDDTSFGAAANVCDESVALDGGGSENRYEMHGAISLARTPSDILSSMMTTCNGNLFWGQGKWMLKAGDYTSSVETFTLDDLRGPINVDTKVSRRDNFNVVRGLFVSATDDYVKTDYPQIRSQTFIDDDGGIENALDLELPMTTSSSMAQRLAKMTLFRAREQMTVQADFSLKAFDVQVGDVISLTISRYGWSAKQFEVVGWSFQNDPDSGGQTVSLVLRETSSAAYDWNAEEEELKVNDSNLPTLVQSATSGLSIVAVYASDASGTGKSYTPSASLPFVLYYQYSGSSLPSISSVTGTWVRFVGEDGEDGVGTTGATGASTNIIFIRASSASAPSASSGVPTGWSDTVPSGTGTLFASVGTKAVGSTVFVWGTPFKAEGTSVVEVVVYRKNSSSGGSGGSYNFVTQTLTTPSGWSESAPSVSANGDVVYRISGVASGSPTETSASITWSSPVIYARRVDGSVGDPGARYATVRYYASGTSAPSTSGMLSSVSYNWSTATATASYGSWSTTAPTVDAAGSNDYFIVDVTFADATGEASTSNGSSVTTAVSLFSFNGLVTFTNASGNISLQQALDHSSTTIDGGKITTNTIEADSIKIDNVTLDTNASNQLIIKGGGVDTSQIASSAISDLSTSYTASASVSYANPGTTSGSTIASTSLSGAQSGDKFLGIVTVGWYTNLSSNVTYINQSAFLNSGGFTQLYHPRLATSTAFASGSTMVGIFTATSSGTVTLTFNPAQSFSSSATATANGIRMTLIRLKR